MSLSREQVGVEVKPPLNTLVAIPNVSAPCPVNMCLATLPDGTTTCYPCLEAPPLGPAADVPTLDTWALLLLGVALVAAGFLESRSRG